VFMARIGHGPAAAARSTRKTLENLVHLTRAPATVGPGSEERP